MKMKFDKFFETFGKIKSHTIKYVYENQICCYLPALVSIMLIRWGFRVLPPQIVCNKSEPLTLFFIVFLTRKSEKEKWRSCYLYIFTDKTFSIFTLSSQKIPLSFFS